MKQKKQRTEFERRSFLRTAGKAAVGAAALMGAKAIGARESAASDSQGPVEGYDWNKHQWGYGIDCYRCIGCLRCVEACKAENGVARDAHHFRTWVERYVYLEGDEDVQPLCPPDLRPGLPDRRDLQDQGRRRADRPRSLYRLPVLRPGLPIRRPLLR
jgi:ferredoxin